MKKVYCYFEALLDGPPHQGELIQLWHRSWRKNGWDVRMLSPRSARRSKLFRLIPSEWFLKRQLVARQILTLAEAGGGLLVDYDLINYGFRPRHYQIQGTDFHSAGLINCSRGLAKRIRQGCDVSLLLDLFPLVEYTTCFGEPDWLRTPLVHFDTESCDGRPKHEVIENCCRPI